MRSDPARTTDHRTCRGWVSGTNDGALDQAADPGSGNFTAPLGCPFAQADSTDDAFLKKLQSRGVVILDEDCAEQAIGVAQEPPEGGGMSVSDGVLGTRWSGTGLARGRL